MKVGDVVRVRHNNDRVFPDRWFQGIIIESKVMGSFDLFSMMCSERNKVFIISLENDEIEIISEKSSVNVSQACM